MHKTRRDGKGRARRINTWGKRQRKREKKAIFMVFEKAIWFYYAKREVEGQRMRRFFLFSFCICTSSPGRVKIGSVLFLAAAEKTKYRGDIIWWHHIYATFLSLHSHFFFLHDNVIYFSKLLFFLPFFLTEWRRKKMNISVRKKAEIKKEFSVSHSKAFTWVFAFFFHSFSTLPLMPLFSKIYGLLKLWVRYNLSLFLLLLLLLLPFPHCVSLLFFFHSLGKEELCMWVCFCPARKMNANFIYSQTHHSVAIFDLSLTVLKAIWERKFLNYVDIIKKNVGQPRLFFCC